MITPEAGSLGNNQALIRTREWLGKPIFPDQKKGRKQAFQLVSTIVNKFLQIGEELIEEEMCDTINSHPEEQVKITPAFLALQHCFKLSEQIQHRALQILAGDKKENRPIDIAALDVIKGFQQVLLATSLVYGPLSLDNSKSSQVRALDELVRYTELTRKDPKGLSFIKELAKSRSSSHGAKDESIKSYEDPELITAGAELAARTYRRMYPIAEKVLSSRS